MVFGGAAIIGLAIAYFSAPEIVTTKQVAQALNTEEAQRAKEVEVIGEKGPKLETGSLSRMVRHPWWRKKMSLREIETICQAIFVLKHNETMALLSDGRNFTWRLEPTAGPIVFEDSAPLWLLQGGGDNVGIQYFSALDSRGKPIRLTATVSQLEEALDAAYASEEKYRRTGKGDAILDQLDQLKVPEDVLKRELERLDELKRAREQERGKPLFPGMVTPSK
jgi:hypothetical protein